MVLTRLGTAHHLGWAVAADLDRLAADLPEPIVAMSLRA